MQQCYVHARASGAQDVAPVGGPVVEVDGVRGAMPAQRAQQHRHHIDLAFLVMRLECNDVARSIVEQTMNAKRHTLATDDQRWAMTDIPVPYRARLLRLPPQ